MTPKLFLANQKRYKVKKVKNNTYIVYLTFFVTIGITCFSYFSTAGVCLRMDAKVTGYDKKHFTLTTALNNSPKKTKEDKPAPKIKIIRSTLSKNLDKFLKMNVGNQVHECFEANSIKKR